MIVATGLRAGETDVQHNAQFAAEAERQREARCSIYFAIAVVWY